MGRRPVITIDGPAGAGKSTVAREVARRLGYTYVDTGAMYRAVTLKVLEEGADPDDAAAVEAVARRAEVTLVPRRDGPPAVLLDGRDVSAEIRSPRVDAAVARVAAVPGVRAALVRAQRRLAAAGAAVLEGRDTGTLVVPDAERKFFLTARPEVRARRRCDQLRAQGCAARLAEVEQELAERDRLDAARAYAPLRPAEDSIIIDTTDLTPAQVVELILSLVGEPAAGG